ncbi:MAG: glycine-rich protein, partial [Prevotella sp.]|nr:glycine-rich protein [Prevotella sp.]
MQTFTAPLNTTYKIECWGASGGNDMDGRGGLGAYTA